MEEKIKTGIKNFGTYISNDRVYAKIRYVEKREDGLYEICIPKAFICNLENVQLTDNGATVTLGYHTFPLGYGIYNIIDKTDEPGSEYLSREKLIKKKVRKMTLRELEKELGYPIEIVEDKENKDG